MKITIDDLKEDITRRYPNEPKLWHFYISMVSYDDDGLSISIVNVLDKQGKYVFLFKDIWSYRLTQENYLTYNQEEVFEGFFFFQISVQSIYQQNTIANTLIGTVHNEQELDRLRTYRLISQNAFVDVLTNTEPIVTFVST